jgi:hypothetical protein
MPRMAALTSRRLTSTVHRARASAPAASASASLSGTVLIGRLLLVKVERPLFCTGTGRGRGAACPFPLVPLPTQGPLWAPESEALARVRVSLMSERAGRRGQGPGRAGRRSPQARPGAFADHSLGAFRLGGGDCAGPDAPGPPGGRHGKVLALKLPVPSQLVRVHPSLAWEAEVKGE